uniref:Uncharacterized protein n=1 Tax=Melopsittacus undulatus TaxID=13146 RepID=A0A8C6J820_MELUD
RRTASPAQPNPAETVPGSLPKRTRLSQVAEKGQGGKRGVWRVGRGGSRTGDLGSRLSTEGESRVRQRRARTAFTSDQVCRLEKTFQRQKYLGALERRKLSAALQLSEIQIKTWFQNRRMKLKRQIQDNQHSLVAPAPLYSFPAGTSPALFQDGLLPFAPMPAVQFGFSFPGYDASQSTYHFMANELPYYHRHFLPHPSFHPVIQNKMDKQCHPVYAL